ncbi:phosphoribosyltransferase [Acidithiobacillus ferrooxidans]|nr:phosphoribosyltransferase [Acidithiobacillus ferrooxidans]
MDIVQSNRAYHTGAKPMERLLARAEFAGEVQPGKRYVLVDDVTTMGSTLADLASYIQAQGGRDSRITGVDQCYARADNGAC